MTTRSPAITIDCAGCEHFAGAAAALEAVLPGLSSLSSAYAAVRAADGLCAQHDRYVAAGSVCSKHQARSPRASFSG